MEKKNIQRYKKIPVLLVCQGKMEHFLLLYYAEYFNFTINFNSFRLLYAMLTLSLVNKHVIKVF